MKDVAVLTLIATLILMFLTLSTMFLLSVSSFDSTLGTYLSRIWRFISSVQTFVGGWSIIVGFLWLIYILVFLKPSFSSSQGFICSVSLFTICGLLILSGFLSALVGIYLNPGIIAVRKTMHEIEL